MSDQGEVNSHNEQYIQNSSQEKDKELGAKAKELLRPENLIGPFKSTDEMMKSLLDED